MRASALRILKNYFVERINFAPSAPSAGGILGFYAPVIGGFRIVPAFRGLENRAGADITPPGIKITMDYFNG